MKVFLLAGTEDGRELALAMQKRGYQVLVSTLTEYGAEIAMRQGLEARFGALDEVSFRKTLREKEIEVIIDATHPYALNIRSLAQRIAEEMGLPYFRWERPALEYPGHPLIHSAGSLDEAARLASQLGTRIFLSTGSKSLPEWLSVPEFNQKEIFVRVLPTSQILKQCEKLGLKPYQVIAMQGPFSQSFNKALWEQLQIDVVITKESGRIGGLDEKVQACLQLNIPIIILERPQNIPSSAKTGGGSPNDRAIELEDFIRKVDESFGF